MSPRPKLDGVRKAQIRAAAADLIAERGLMSTRIEDIAARAGTSKPAVLYWFSNKDELLTEALTTQDERLYGELAAGIDSLEGAGDQLRLLVDTYMARYDYRLWMELMLRALRDPHIEAVRRAFDRRWRAMIAQVIEEGQRTGEFGAADPDAAAIALTALLDGLRVQVALGDDDVPAERAARLWLASAAAWLTPALLTELDEQRLQSPG
jgi:AcrR family transcriptional regulator